MFDVLVAIDSKGGLSRNSRLPWSNTDAGKEDMQFFKQTTSGCSVIMGRKTYESLPRLLHGRRNIIVSRTMHQSTTGILTDTPSIVVNNFEEALRWAVGKTYVIGGSNLLHTALSHPNLQTVIICKFHHDYSCDIVNEKLLLIYNNGNICKTLSDYSRSYTDYTNYKELEYIGLLRKCLTAPERPNRTGIPTRGIFDHKLCFDLTNENGESILPLLTTKKVFYRSIFHELIWFMRGSTTTEYLDTNNIKIWSGNSTREYLDSRGLNDYQIGELGPIYGYQWRNWGRDYTTIAASKTTAGTTSGIDQLQWVVNEIIENPGSRRLIVNAWNPTDLPKMALPPCHYSFQFHVGFKNGGPETLNCLVNMRSADVALGVPFNIASYGLLTHMIARITKLKPGELHINMADCHIYTNHIDGIKKQLRRMPYRFPQIKIADSFNTLDDFTNRITIDDIEIIGYKCHPYIKLQMAV